MVAASLMAMAHSSSRSQGEKSRTLANARTLCGTLNHVVHRQRKGVKVRGHTMTGCAL